MTKSAELVRQEMEHCR